MHIARLAAMLYTLFSLTFLFCLRSPMVMTSESAKRRHWLLTVLLLHCWPVLLMLLLAVLWPPAQMYSLTPSRGSAARAGKLFCCQRMSHSVSKGAELSQASSSLFYPVGSGKSPGKQAESWQTLLSPEVLLFLLMLTTGLEYTRGPYWLPLG